MAEVSGGSPILHVVVVGFHHKKGCQVEYSYPPLIEGNPVDSHELPEQWKHLPSLALPDGAHNYTKDTTYFHLVSRDGSNATVYGVSCYRQMDSKDLINRTADVTRSSVQKSVCVLSKLPLYGAIQAKLEMITHAYFDGRDFSQVSLLRQTYTNLVTSFPSGQLDLSRALHGLKPCDIVVAFRHKILVLFKLLLLERRVLIYGTPVYQCSSVLLSLLSLLPEMIEHGLSQSVSYPTHNIVSPTMQSLTSEDESDFVDIHFHQSDEGQISRDTSCDIVVLSGDSSERERNEQTSSISDDNLDSKVTESDNGRDSAMMAGGDLDGPYARLDRDGKVTADAHKRDIDPLSRGELLCDTGDVLNCDVIYNKDIKLLDSPHEENTEPKIEIKIDKISQEDKSKTSPIISYNDRDDPLADIAGITNLENVQSNADVQYFTDESIALQTTDCSSPVTLRKVVIPTLEEVKRIGAEEIDSPESIDQIDQEDCFSWENDSLMLAIEQELGNVGANGMPGTRTSTFYVDLDDPPEQAIERRADGDVDPTPDVAQTLEVAGESETVPKERTTDGKTIRDKLASAFASLNKQKDGRDGWPVSTFKHLSDDVDIGLTLDTYGFPLAIFTKGSLCHPYLCLQYYDVLRDVNVRSFVIGASNILFKQNKHLVDVVVDISEMKVDIHDPELRRQLTLSTADLRFSDHLVKAVSDTSNNMYLHETEWEGGNEWLRAQFRVYLQSLLAASIHSDSKYLEDYHPAFVSAWSTTRNYSVWQKLDHSAYIDVVPNHPCHGNLSMTDLKVRWTSTMQSTDKGRRLNSAMTQTGKYVVQTGKVVGGALTSAKSAVSSWFSNLTSDG